MNYIVPFLEWGISCLYTWWHAVGNPWGRRCLYWRPPCSPIQTQPTSVWTLSHYKRPVLCSPWYQCEYHLVQQHSCHWQLRSHHILQIQVEGNIKYKTNSSLKSTTQVLLLKIFSSFHVSSMIKSHLLNFFLPYMFPITMTKAHKTI